MGVGWLQRRKRLFDEIGNVHLKCLPLYAKVKGSQEKPKPVTEPWEHHVSSL